ncbi:STAS domain-containing protein [Kitasatospora terrestris]|uniref:Anti-sigma factor antagonist n=1 Tax=Kitasatospora terrestris TaxID=258051 RepID=A0ABP9D5J3_9ACTN
MSAATPVTALALSVSCVARDELAVLTVTGELDVATGPLLYVHLSNQLAHGRRHLVLDLGGVPFMDSSGLNVIIRAVRATRAEEGSLTLVGLTPQVDQLFRLTGIGLTQQVHPDVESAVASLGLEMPHPVTED